MMDCVAAGKTNGWYGWHARWVVGLMDGIGDMNDGWCGWQD
jgi:hypothetical protein